MGRRAAFISIGLGNFRSSKRLITILEGEMFKTLKRCIEELPILRAMKAREDGDEDEALRIEQEYEDSLPPYPPDSKKEIVAILKANGFIRGCSEWPEYSRAKRVVVGGRWLDSPEHYSRIIGWICDYLSL